MRSEPEQTHQSPKAIKNRQKSQSDPIVSAQTMQNLIKCASTADQYQDLIGIFNATIRKMSFKQKDLISHLFSQSIAQRFPSFSSIEISQQNSYESTKAEVQSYHTANIDNIFTKLTHCFMNIFKASKQCQIATPIANVFFKTFLSIAANAIDHEQVRREQVLEIWPEISYRNIQEFITSLGLQELFSSIAEQKFVKYLSGLLTDLKVVQCCCYYLAYRHSIPEFQQQELGPKIANLDQLLSPPIIDLLKQQPHLKDIVISELDKAKAVLLMEHLSEDPRKYEALHHFILRKHYLSMKQEYLQWYVFEDKMNFEKTFISWFCEEYKQGDQDEKFYVGVNQAVCDSIKARNGQLSQTAESVPNPLFEHDEFTAVEVIMHKHALSHPTNFSNNEYVLLKDYQIAQEQIFFLSLTEDKRFEQMAEHVLSASQVGFDAQNRCSATKYDQQGVSLLQLNTRDRVYILDFWKLQTDKVFLQFLFEFVGRADILKIGHTVQSDIKYLQKSMELPECKGFVDISKLFRQRFPQQTLTSLAFMVRKLTGKKLSKYEQRSNWNRRPLKQSQLHYAALDAVICPVIYKLLHQQHIYTFQAGSVTINQTKPVIKEEIIRQENLVFAQSQSHLLEQPRPKFMVDCMLKKLCTIMRNIGIDAEYMAHSNFQAMKNIAEKQHRIILTRDAKLMKKKHITSPMYCIKEKGNSQLMFEQIKTVFKLNLEDYETLSRCVKCNSEELQVISRQEAMKTLAFQYEESNINEFWKCAKCKQIYWQGNQFKNAKHKFNNMKEDK